MRKLIMSVMHPGLSGLKNVTTESFDLTHSNQTHLNALMKVRIYNPSVIYITPMGN